MSPASDELVDLVAERLFKDLVFCETTEQITLLRLFIQGLAEESNISGAGGFAISSFISSSNVAELFAFSARILSPMLPDKSAILGMVDKVWTERVLSLRGQSPLGRVPAAINQKTNADATPGGAPTTVDGGGAATPAQRQGPSRVRTKITHLSSAEMKSRLEFERRARRAKNVASAVPSTSRPNQHDTAPSGRGETPPRCPKDHPLQFITGIPKPNCNWTCNACGGKIGEKARGVARCDECNFDVCPRCLPLRLESKKERASGPDVSKS